MFAFLFKAFKKKNGAISSLEAICSHLDLYISSPSPKIRHILWKNALSLMVDREYDKYPDDIQDDLFAIFELHDDWYNLAKDELLIIRDRLCNMLNTLKENYPNTE